MIGVVLCGGLSSRMGNDKGLIVEDNESWAQSAFNKLYTLNIPVYVSVSETQTSIYLNHFLPLQLIADNPLIEVKGPMLGILSVHLQKPDEDILVLACDMPFMQPDLLKELKVKSEKSNYDVVLFENNNNLEPLCAIYKATALEKISDLINKKLLKKYSMKYMLEQLSAHKLKATESQLICFKNMNTDTDRTLL